MLRSFCALFLLVVCQSLPAANVCVNNTLDTYEALGSTGCVIAGLTVKDFLFSVVSSGGGATPIAASDINVITHFPAGSRGLECQSNWCSVIGTQFVNYLIAFRW